MNRCLSLVLVMLAALIVGAAPAQRPPTSGQKSVVAKARKARMLIGPNLIQNGSAEIVEEGWAVAWSPEKTLESETYGHTAGEWDTGVTGAAEGGERYFRLPVPDGKESIEFDQWVSVAPESMAIDSSVIRFTLAGWVGGTRGDPGTAVLAAQFVDAGGNVLAAAATQPVASEDLPPPSIGAASLVERTQSGSVPPRTRRVHVMLSGINRTFAECNNCSALGLADKLSLILARATKTH